MKITLFLTIVVFLVSSAFAMESSRLQPRQKWVAQGFQSYVNTENCTQPIRSSAYVIVAGNGGANMRLTCPPEKPVMYGWRQEVGYGGWPAVSFGGGASWITCCAVSHQWKPVNPA